MRIRLKRVSCLSLVLAGVLLVLVPQAVAQPTNEFHVYTNRTSFTSRGFLGGNAGEVLQGYPSEQFRGIGDTGLVPKNCVVHQFGMVTQDQDRTTLEQYAVIFRRSALDGTPDGSPAGVIFETGTMLTPAIAGDGPVAFSVNVNLGAEGVSVPCKETFYAGVSLSANPSWIADGQSVHASAYTNPTSSSGDPVRAGAPNHAYQVDAAGAVRPTNPRSWHMNLQTRRGAFQVGCIQTADGPGLYGNCGNYPDLNHHGLAFRIRDAAHAGHMAAVYMSTDLIGGARKMGVDGLWWVSPGKGHLTKIAEGVLNGSGFLELKPAMTQPGSDFLMQLQGIGNVPFVAVIENAGIRTTNAQASDLQ